MDAQDFLHKLHELVNEFLSNEDLDLDDKASALEDALEFLDNKHEHLYDEASGDNGDEDEESDDGDDDEDEDEDEE